ncbi:RelA/SpoT family protein [Myxococcota bacterium]|nr:RelA/SpoT family protein [Myxococcota bacterium]
MKPDLSFVLKHFDHNFNGVDPQPIRHALDMAVAFHQQDRRKSGEPYIVHPVSVAGIVAELGMDRDAICAALFHDVALTAESLQIIETNISSQCRYYVERLSQVRRIRPQTVVEQEMEGYRKMVLAISEDLRVTLIRIADRLDNMRTIDILPDEEKHRVAKEVRLLYIPLANRMGLSAVKAELENRCFAVLEPDACDELEKNIEAMERSRKAYVDEVVGILRGKLAMEGYTPMVYGRPKHLYSIFLKMVRQGKSLEQIHDILAFRIVCETSQQCYGILGVIHSFLKPFPKLFKDYIALPKPNGYQSLHTTVEGPSGRRIEIQIRTEEMHEISEKGVAAHWLYKERHKRGPMESGRFRAIQNTVDALKRPTDEGEDFWSLASFKAEIFVFTPAGELVQLPTGATALDFAFAVHSQVGSHCTGSLVNGAMVPLRTVLKTWDRVEIITSPNQEPKADWLSFAVTTKARNKIKHHMGQIKRDASRQEGRLLMEKLLKKNKISYPRLLKEGAFEKAARELRFMNQDDLFLGLGEKKITPEKVLVVVVPELAEEKEEKPKPEPKKQKSEGGKSGPPIEIDGLRNVLIRFARCCQAMPGDPITGFITRGRGVTIHKATCERLSSMQEERFIEAKWLVDPSAGDPVTLKVITDNKPGILALMSDVFAKQSLNIQRLAMEQLKSSRTAVFFYFTATRPTTDTMVRNLRKIKGVYSVSRVSHQPSPQR